MGICESGEKRWDGSLTAVEWVGYRDVKDKAMTGR